MPEEENTGGVRLHMPSQKTIDQIENNFTYHKPIAGQVPRYTQIRQSAKNLASIMSIACPEGRELSTALTNLEQAVMWANAAIARGEKE